MAVEVNNYLKVSSDTLDFHMLNYGEIGQENIYLKNISHEDIEILDYQKSCSCTRAIFQRGVIRPGLQQQLTVEVNTKKAKAGQGRSVINLLFLIRGEKVRLPINVIYNIRPSNNDLKSYIEPKYIQLKDVDICDLPFRGMVTVHGINVEKCELKTDSDFIKFLGCRMSKGLYFFPFEVTIDKDKTVKLINTKIYLELNGKKHEIPIYIQLMEPLSVNNGHGLNITVYDVNEVNKKVVTGMKRSDINIKRIYVNENGLHIERLKEIKDRNYFEFVMTMDPHYFNGKLSLKNYIHIEYDQMGIGQMTSSHPFIITTIKK